MTKNAMQCFNDRHFPEPNSGHGEAAFQALLGWMSPEDQAEFREAIFGAEVKP